MAAIATREIIETQELDELETAPKKLYSIEEYEQLPSNGMRYELIEGELVEVASTGDEHGRIGSRLHMYLANHVYQNKLGEVYWATGFKLATRTAREPDIAFLSAARVPPKSKGILKVPPDLAIEIVSPSDVFVEVEEKVAMYQKAGVPLVWVISPTSQVLFVYHLESGLLPQTFGVKSEFDGKNIIPNFKLKISLVFE